MLPIDAILPELQAALEQTSTILLQAPPGAGKTTRVPLALLDSSWRGDGKILMLEPRRLAARSAARFMARQLNEQPGQTVGYRTRLDTRVSGATRIEVVTEGILTRLIQADPMLEDYAAVIFDEFHERSLQADLGLALVRESQQALREDLRLLVMSATLDTAPIAKVLGDVPVITSEGRAFPVDVHYRPLPRNGRVVDQVASVVQEALRDQTGSLLVFLPGAGEIRRVEQQLRDNLPDQVMIAPLYGNLKAEQQDQAISPASEGQRKVVLATAIAETSLTIEGVRVVIDSGQQRRAVFDPNSGMTRLVTGRVSKASAEQRKGRAGRVEPGICYRLWSESEQFGLADYTPPEILEADLAPLVLELAQWGARDAAAVAWIDEPPAAHWQQAVVLLQWLDMLDSENHLPKTLLYVLNPRDNDLIASLIGAFQDGSVPGKIQFGSGWWFNDHKEGMERQMTALANMGILYRFVGMLTDSRSFLSFPRHEYFRRILCNLIGEWVERGEAPRDMNFLGEMVKRISYQNAEEYFNIPGNSYVQQE